MCLRSLPSPLDSLFPLPSCIVFALGYPWYSITVAMVMCVFLTRYCVRVPNTCHLLSWCLPELYTDGLRWEVVPYLIACYGMYLLLWQVILLPSDPIFEEMFLMTGQVYLRESSLLKTRKETEKHLLSHLLFLESPGSGCLMVELLIPAYGLTPSE